MVALAATGFFLAPERKVMATFSIEIPDNEVDRIISAMCGNYKYQAQIHDPNYDPLEEYDHENPTLVPPHKIIDNPENPYQFVNRMVREYLINNTLAYEKEIARQQVENSVGNAPVITDPN